jgi:PAS domain S-box-containing protein
MLFPDKGALIVDLEGRIEFASNYFCDLIGVTTFEIIRKSCFDFVYPDDLPHAHKLLESSRQPNPAPSRFRLQDRDGNVTWADFQGAPMQTAAGSTYGIVLTVTSAL